MEKTIVSFCLPPDSNLDKFPERCLLVPLPDRWPEFIQEGCLESMFLDFSEVWKREIESNSDECKLQLFKLFGDLLFDGFICRRVIDE